ncbi:MATH domain and coiled-coil domain-containing protein At3g58270-like [Actinidia eriantha]|uniref:MATH domain and coiled-coil domain-containing protein At3g58270-like n=1 Tax=Actinidia eriantha TaxID=165200 RepID=UPI00258C2D58|nr:MATH domain and coiled-coil domain-containing protein At3g58270-like [Actinidia eriantha]
MAETTDRPSSRFTWTIEKFSSLSMKLYSEIFNFGGYNWRVLIFPKGNNVDHLSLYLDVADSPTLPHGWSRHTQFSLALVNQVRKSETLKKDTQHTFNARESDWGFTSFICLSELLDTSKGYLVNDTIRIEANVTVNRSKDPKEETCVGVPENCRPEQGSREEDSRLPSQDTNSGNAEANITGTSPPPEQPPTLRFQTPSVNTTQQESSDATEVSEAPTVPQAGGLTSGVQALDNPGRSNTVSLVDEAPDGKVRFLSYWVSSEASSVLEKIYGLHKDTFANFSMKGQTLQTVLLESFASFIVSMSTTKVNEVNEEVLRASAISIEDFEQLGLDLSWLKQRLDEAKTLNKHTDSLVYVDLCENALKVARAKVRELEEGLARAKTEAKDMSRDLPISLGADDRLLKDVM